MKSRIKYYVKESILPVFWLILLTSSSSPSHTKLEYKRNIDVMKHKKANFWASTSYENIV